MGFSRQEYWSGLPLPPPGDLPHPGFKPTSLMSLALASGFFTISDTWEALSSVQFSCSVVSNSLRPHESQHARPACPSSSPGVHSNSRPSSRWCDPAISSSVVPFSSCPQSKSTYWIAQGSLLNTLWSSICEKETKRVDRRLCINITESSSYTSKTNTSL